MAPRRPTTPPEHRMRLWVDGRPVASAEVARTRRARAIGLLGRPPSDAALVLARTRSVHGIGMDRALDVAQCDAAGRVVAMHHLRPGRLVLPRHRVRWVVEAEVGSFAGWGLAVGSVVAVR